MSIRSCSVFARFTATALVVATVSVPRLASAQGALKPSQQLAHDIYKELVEINSTTDADPGGTTQAAEAMAARLRAAGFSGSDVQVLRA